MNRLVFLILIGLGGAATLIALGIWQTQRLAWKQGVIADIEARIGGAPVALPAQPDPKADAYLPVSVEGVLGSNTLRVLVSQKDEGAGYRLITPLTLEGRAILLDRGFVSALVSETPSAAGPVSVTGNLQWPDETDVFTPDPDLGQNIWFARDVDKMSKALETDPILLVARTLSQDDPRVTPLPVDTSRIPNNHLQYAITWFSLAAVWLAMTFLFLRRRSGQPAES